MKKKITRCPHCGSTEGIFTKTVYRNVIHNIGFDGEEQENYEMYDEATIEQGKIAYCQEFGEPICRMSTLRAQWGAQDESP